MTWVHHTKIGLDTELSFQEEPEEPIQLPAVEEVDSLNLAREGITTIIWATGHAYEFDWVKIPVLDDRGRPIQQRGVTPVPGLYFFGLQFASVGGTQPTIAS